MQDIAWKQTSVSNKMLLPPSLSCPPQHCLASNHTLPIKAISKLNACLFICKATWVIDIQNSTLPAFQAGSSELI